MAAILFAIAGAAVLLSRIFIIELCNVDGANVREPCVTGRAFRRRNSGLEVPIWSSAGFNWQTGILTEGKNISLEIEDFKSMRVL